MNFNAFNETYIDVHRSPNILRIIFKQPYRKHHLYSVRFSAANFYLKPFLIQNLFRPQFTDIFTLTHVPNYRIHLFLGHKNGGRIHTLKCLFTAWGS